MQPGRAAADELLAHALGLPGAWEDHPWGERVAKVGTKVFVFLGKPGPGEWGCSVKLPASGTSALDKPFAEPTGYGLGRSGWVTARFEERERAPLELLRAWIEESYRAVAPKKLVKELDARAGVSAAAAPGRGKVGRQPAAAKRPKPSRSAPSKPAAARAPQGKGGARSASETAKTARKPARRKGPRKGSGGS